MKKTQRERGYIAEVKKKVYDIASGCDEVISYHAGRSYCEHRCKQHKKFQNIIEANAAAIKVLEKWAWTKIKFKRTIYMEIKVLEKNNVICAIVQSDNLVIIDSQSDLDVLMQNFGKPGYKVCWIFPLQDTLKNIRNTGV